MNIAIKLLIVGFLILIVFNLGKAMTIMLKPKSTNKTMSTFIGRRLLFSVALILLLLISLLMGWVQPNPRPY